MKSIYVALSVMTHSSVDGKAKFLEHIIKAAKQQQQHQDQDHPIRRMLASLINCDVNHF